ncbi:MAG: helix-turn-helix domain-containing protein [Planctomycetota bacterium]
MASEKIKHWFERGADTPGAFSVHGVGIRETMPPSLVNRPEGTGDTLLMLFHSTALVQSEEGFKECAPETLILWDESMGHIYGCETEAWCHSWLHCGGGTAKRLIHESGLDRNRLITGCGEIFLSGLALLYEERVRPDFDAVILGNHFESMLRGIKRLAGSSSAEQVPQRLLRAKRMVEVGYASGLRLEDLAAKANLSPSHFSSEYRRHFGISPIQDATRLRMLEAEHLLRDVNLSISEVAVRVGYPDIFHFSKQFKRRYGQNPTEWRRGH